MSKEYLIIGVILATFILILVFIGKFKRRLTLYSYNQNMKYKLIRDNKKANSVYDILPLSLKDTKHIDKNQLYSNLSKEYDDRVINFIDKIVINFKDINLYLLSNNLNNVKINKLKLHSFNTVFSSIKISSGEYNIKQNQIIYYDIKNCNNLEHELFHLATAKIESNFMCTGFAYYFDNSAIGYGLNEGYTQLLSNRYFYGLQDFYYYEKSIAFMIENIIGKDKLIKMYFEADLRGLIDALAVYISKDEVIKLITNIDKFSRVYSYQDLNNPKTALLLVNLLKDIQMVLLTIIYNETKSLKINYISKFHNYEVINDSFLNQIICKEA